MKVEKPELNGRTDRENIQKLETWAANLADELNHTINHLDKTNLVEDMEIMTRTEVQELLDKQYRELRELIVTRTKGE